MSYTIHSNFNEKAGFDEVKFGSQKPVLETELNEMQQIQNNARKNVVVDFLGSGVLKEPVVTLEKGGTISFTEGMTAYVEGTQIYIPETYSRSVTVNANSSYLVFLEVWTEEITKDSELKEYGGDYTSTISNHLQDSRFPIETARRVATKWRVRIELGTNMTSMKVKGKASSNTTTTFSLASNGIYKGVNKTASFSGVTYGLLLYKYTASVGELTKEFTRLKTMSDLQTTIEEHEFGWANTVTTIINGSHKQIVKRYNDGRMEIIQTFAMLTGCRQAWGTSYIHSLEGTVPSDYAIPFLESEPQVAVSCQGSSGDSSFSVCIKGSGTSTHGPKVQIIRPATYEQVDEWRVLIHAFGTWKAPVSPNIIESEPLMFKEPLSIEYGPVIVPEEQEV